MKIPMSWLSDYMDTTGITPEDYNHRMTMTGSKVEKVENTGDEIQNVITAKILSVEPHPDADKLKICQLDTGSKTIQIVTGADNVKPGQIVPVALDGAVLPGGKTIKKGKLRGVESNGMMCSYEEIGMTKEDFPDAEYGILILDNTLPLGKDIRDVFGLNENIVEFEITSNRPDCLSVIGLARESAITFGRKFNLKTPEVKGVGDDINNYAKVSVNDDLCLRYSAKVVKNIKIAPSPKWLADRLKACGVRSINNIVDITNYIMLEYGQPMHAFDLNYLEGGKINVRRAKNSEKVITLDEVERTLDDSMLMICDADKPVAVAGVMGALNSEVRADTKTILFESATFVGPSVRVTARKLGLRTESSARYEKGLDPNNTVPAVMRACELVEMLGAGEVVDGIIDVYNVKREPVTLELEPEKINKFIGMNVSREFMEKTLTDLGFSVNGTKISAPTYRGDILCMADVAEEIARIYGYDKLPSTQVSGAIHEGKKTVFQRLEDKTKNILTACGLYEIITYSFTNPNIFDKLNMPADAPLRDTVVITNPLGAENSIMRTTMLASMMETLTRNINASNLSAKLFELGKIYIKKEGEQLPDEKKTLVMGMYGDVDYYTLKGAVEELFEGLGINKIRVSPMIDNPTFHPGRAAMLMRGNTVIGIMGQIHPSVCDNYGISTEIYAAEISFDELLAAAKCEKTYTPLPKYPAVNRDIAILVDDKVLAADVEEIIRKKSKNLFAELKLFDVYKGKQIPDGKKSMAYSVTFRSNEKTLTDEDINKAMTEILDALKFKLGAELR